MLCCCGGCNIMLGVGNKKLVVPFRSKSQLKLPQKHVYESRQPPGKSYKLTLTSVGVIDSLKHHRANNEAKMAHALHPQLQKKTLENIYRVNKSRSLKQILEAKLRTQEQRMHDIKVREEMRQEEIALARKMQTREKDRQLRESRREAQTSREIEQSWRQKTQQRQRSESSFLQTTRRETFGMLRRSRQLQSRSQQSLAEEHFRETVRSSKYEQEKKSLERRKQQYELQYRKAFLKNNPPPKQDLPEAVLYSTLRERAERLTETYSQPQHLPSISRSTAPKISTQTAKKMKNLEHELMISSMRPTEQRTKKQKALNPQASPAPLAGNPGRVIDLPIPDPAPALEQSK